MYIANYPGEYTDTTEHMVLWSTYKLGHSLFACSQVAYMDVW